MRQDCNEEGRFSQNSRGLGTVTKEMVRRRAVEIAIISGRAPEQVLDSDLAQAQRELTGEERLYPERTAEESLPESARETPLHPTEGGRVETISAPDEQTFAEKLVDEGVQEAEHDQMVRATREAAKRDTEG